MQNLTRTLRTSLILTVGASAVACAPSLESMSLWQPLPQARAVKADLRSSIGYYENAVTAINDRHYAIALEYLQAARAQKPDDVRVLTAFGVVYDKLGRFDLSARYYAQAMTLDPKSHIVAADMDYSHKLQGISSASPPIAVAQTGPAGAQNEQIAVSQETLAPIADNAGVARESVVPTNAAAINVSPAMNADIPPAPKPSLVAAAGVEPKHVTSDKAAATEVRPATSADVVAAPKPSVGVITATEYEQATLNRAATAEGPATTADLPAAPKPSVANTVDAGRKAVIPDKVATVEPRLVSKVDEPAVPKPSLQTAAEVGPAPVTVGTVAMVEVRPTARPDVFAAPKPVATATEIERKPPTPAKVVVVQARPVAQIDVPAAPKPSLLATAGIEHKTMMASNKAAMVEARPAVPVNASAAPKSVVVKTIGAGYQPMILNKSALVEARPLTKAGVPAAPKPSLENAAGAGHKLLALIKLALVEIRAITKTDAPAVPKPSMVRNAEVELRPTTLNKFGPLQAATRVDVPAAPKPSPTNAAEVRHEPNKAALVEARPILKVSPPLATKPVFLTGYPLSIVNASGRVQADETVKAYLSGKGWSVANSDSTRSPARTETTIVYRETMIEAAKALARTLPLPVELNASDNVQGLQLVLGADLSGTDLTGRLRRNPHRRVALAAVEPKVQE